MAISLTVKDVNIHVGDIVRVHLRIKEGDKERIQIFEGLLIAIRGREAENKTFTVRKMSTANIGVERIFPVVSPWIAKIEVKKTGQVRRAKLYYVREKSNRQVAAININS
ncbi:MAG: 50S ribosomal protein L19 [Patescibacteria group bacterium]